MKRIFSRNDHPFIVGQYLVADVIHRMIPEKLWKTELVSTLLYDTKDVGLSNVRQTFRVVSSMPTEADELDIRVHDPVVRVRRIFQNARKEVLCLAQLVYRTDGVVFDINIGLDDRNRLFTLRASWCGCVSSRNIPRRTSLECSGPLRRALIVH